MMVNCVFPRGPVPFPSRRSCISCKQSTAVSHVALKCETCCDSGSTDMLLHHFACGKKFHFIIIIFCYFSLHNEPAVSLGMEICKWSGCSLRSSPSVCFHVGSRQLVRERLSQFPGRVSWRRAQ